MANFVASGNLAVSNDDLWITNFGASTSERFSGVTSDTGPVLLGLGSRTVTYSELKFESGGLTYRYIGNWQVTADNGLVTSNVEASGSYSSIIVENGGTTIASYIGPSLAVDFGDRTGLTLLDLAGATIDIVFDILFGTSGGGGGNQAFANLHLDATPALPEIAFSGSDAIAGGTAANWLVGHNGDDFMSSGPGNDVLFGGNGPGGIFDVGSDVIYLGGGTDIANGQGGNDSVYGENGDDYLYGDTGNDLLSGGLGTDYLYGNEGQDRLYGGQGNDILYGGTETDLFIFGEAGLTKGEIDVIADFQETASGTPDLIYLPAEVQATSFSFIGPDGYTYIGLQAGSGYAYVAVSGTDPHLVQDQLIWY